MFRMLRVAWYVALGLVALADASRAQRASQVVVRGTLVDSVTRRPINGVIVEFASDAKRYSALSDEAGQFRVVDVDPARYRLVARRIGYAPMVRQIVVTEDMKPLAIRMAPTAQTLRAVRVRGEGMGIYGQIGAASDLKVIPGATVEIAGAAMKVITDSAGSYFATVGKPGPYMVRVNAPGFAEEAFLVNVQKNQVADGSRLLEVGEGMHIPDGLWKDFDQRVRWRSSINSTLVSGADVRRAGGSLNDAVQSVGSVVSHGLRLGSKVCVLVNGVPRPGLPLNAIRPEEITAIEVYGPDREVGMFLTDTWPRGAPCSQTGLKTPPLRVPTIGYVVIWTR